MRRTMTGLVLRVAAMSGRGLHGFGREREHGKHADPETESTVLRHVEEATIRGGSASVGRVTLGFRGEAAGVAGFDEGAERGHRGRHDQHHELVPERLQAGVAAIGEDPEGEHDGGEHQAVL